MDNRGRADLRRLSDYLYALPRFPGLSTLIPAIMIGAFLIWGETGLMAAALLLTTVLALFASCLPRPRAVNPLRPKPHGREDMIGLLDDCLRQDGRITACIVTGLDDPDDMAERLGHRGLISVRDRFSDRARAALREADILVPLDESTLAMVLAPMAQIDIETLLSLSSRMQQAMADPVTIDGATIYATVSVGFVATDRMPDATGEAILDAAEAAMIEARRHGPGSIRAHSREMARARIARNALIDEARDALEMGHIAPWFQPQLSTDTGQVSGFEALARWDHPDRGLISPQEFLPALERAGLMERLGEVVLYHAFTALRAWDRAGETVPTVGINFSAVELRNPTLLDKITWELDRFELEPKRLTVEILESVIADAEDEVTQRNIAGLAKLGCQIDLDDFGTGHASMTSLRRFSVSRIKIDRSFVMKVDSDRDQQRMVSAILTMAEQLDLESVGEGVETAGEHTMLSQLGCRHVQGFGLGRPMPFAETLAWLRTHRAKLAHTPEIGRGRRAG